MAKIIFICFAIFLLASQQQSCEAQMDITSFAKTAVGIGQFVYKLGEKLLQEPKTLDESMYLIRNMNEEITSDLKDIMKILKDLPSIMYFIQKEFYLDDTLDKIGFIFNEAVRMQKTIQDGIIEDKQIYEEFSRYGNELDEHMHTVRTIILSKDTMRDLIQNFTTDEQIYNSACETGMSHLQLLDTLLRTLKVTTAQYYVSRVLIYDFLDIHNDEPIHSERKKDLTERVQFEYKYAILQFKQIMNNASRELWTCDYRDYSGDERCHERDGKEKHGRSPLEFQNVLLNPHVCSICQDFEYYELMAFQKYLINEDHFGSLGYKCDLKCPNIHKMNDCSEGHRYFCKSNRICKHRLVGCKKINHNDKESTVVCVNKDANSQARYKAIVPNKKEYTDDLYCPNKEAELITLWDLLITTSYNSYFCDFCGCVCEEKQYRINLDYNLADARSNKVITGARLRVLWNTIHIQIQQGTLSVNGTVDESTVEWMPVNDISAKTALISWDGIRDINLGSILLSANRVLTGIKFNSIGANRIALSSFSHEFNFATGKLKQNSGHEDLPIIATQEIDLSNDDVPVKYKKQNYPESNENKFVKFQLSSLAKDGGQTTIPFIDTQKVYTKPSMPLSGVGLVLRKAKGYGGFLALKLYTYDTNPFIDEAADLNSDFTAKKEITTEPLKEEHTWLPEVLPLKRKLRLNHPRKKIPGNHRSIIS